LTKRAGAVIQCADRRIRIRIKMSQIRNTGNNHLVRDKKAMKKYEFLMVILESIVQDPNPVGHVQYNFVGSGSDCPSETADIDIFEWPNPLLITYGTYSRRKYLKMRIKPCCSPII
jgi:hypothetical protein